MNITSETAGPQPSDRLLKQLAEIDPNITIDFTNNYKYIGVLMAATKLIKAGGQCLQTAVGLEEACNSCINLEMPMCRRYKGILNGTISSNE